MKYRDDAANNTVNGFLTGVRIGSPLRDALAPANDGHNHLRSVERVGSVLQDHIGVNPTPLVLAIEITTPPSKQQYLIGEEIDLTGIVVNAYYSGGTTGIVTVTEDNITGFDSFEAAASQTVTVTVDDGTDTFEISIVEG